MDACVEHLQQIQISLLEVYLYSFQLPYKQINKQTKTFQSCSFPLCCQTGSIIPHWSWVSINQVFWHYIPIKVWCTNMPLNIYISPTGRISLLTAFGWSIYENTKGLCGVPLLLKLTLNYCLFKNKWYEEYLVTCYSYNSKMHLWSFLALVK